MSTAILDMLLAEMPVASLPLPGIKFFEPRTCFIRWMRERFAGLPVFDIGAGVGHVSDALTRAGFDCTALDLILRDNIEFPVQLANSVSYQYPADAVLLFCRPCHNDFVRATITQGLRCGVRHFIYVSKPANAPCDLSHYRGVFRWVKRNVGSEKESIYLWER